ncbi:deoxyribodipyrimidine photo-lyase [Caballeronia mineralivorans]|uniref:deoxyribodipyrimidine photo-lyase n=1 Tax=Caballeronia mineralivorans TaxID=2010198 RepID=UPI00094FE933
MADFDLGLVWFRRDLRVADHAALYHAVTRCRRVLCAFVFDSEILSPLPSKRSSQAVYSCQPDRTR